MYICMWILCNWIFKTHIYTHTHIHRCTYIHTDIDTCTRIVYNLHKYVYLYILALFLSYFFLSYLFLSLSLSLSLSFCLSLSLFSSVVSRCISIDRCHCFPKSYLRRSRQVRLRASFPVLICTYMYGKKRKREQENERERESDRERKRKGVRVRERARVRAWHIEIPISGTHFSRCLIPAAATTMNLTSFQTVYVEQVQPGTNSDIHPAATVPYHRPRTHEQSYTSNCMLA